MNEEIRDGYVVSAEMKKVWDIQMRLMRKVLDVCRENDLNIWVDGGTLLGAVRHHGYIPWDDDIDLIMMRDDYERLQHIADQHFTPPLFFQTAYTDQFYPRGHAQVRYDGTAAILPGEERCKFHQGIFIDIFVFDSLPKNGETLLRAIFKAEPLRKLLQWRSSFGFSFSSPAQTLRWLVSRLYFAFHDYRKTFAKFENCYARYEGERSDILSSPCFYAASVFKNRHRREWFRSTVMLPFEDMMVPAPIDYDKVLRTYYGDYMTPVKAPSMHGNVVFDTKRSYKEVLKDAGRRIYMAILR